MTEKITQEAIPAVSTLIQNDIATIIIDLPQKSMNILNKQALEELSLAVMNTTQNTAIKGIIITSGKNNFLAGVDLSLLSHLCNPYARTSESERILQGKKLIGDFHHVLRTLETCGKPVVCGITGTCLGGGYEIALACHYRIMSDTPKAVIGLPEAKVGLMPGFGGTQRLPRLIGIEPALHAITQGTAFSATQALKLGMIDAIVSEKKLQETAFLWIQEAINKGDCYMQPWDQKQYKIPNGGIYDPQNMPFWAAANATLFNQTQGLYDNIKAIMQAFYEGLTTSFDKSLDLEIALFVKLMVSPQSFHMTRSLFLSKQALDKGERRPKEIAVNPLDKIGIIGAGMMGLAIAYQILKSSSKVILIEETLDKAQQAKQNIESLLQKEVDSGKLSAGDHDKFIKKATYDTDYAALKGCRLVIEATHENLALKQELYGKLAEHIGSKAIIASNTSSLLLKEIAEHYPYKKNVIGLHFFSPVAKMPLVEIVQTSKTGDIAIAIGFDLVKRLKKTPILVQDSPFFYANRCLVPYLHEALLMVTEGVSPILIEQACIQLGFPMGALSLCDEVSLDLCAAIMTSDDIQPDNATDLIALLLEHKRQGKKNKQGFFDYGTEKKLWGGLSEHYPLSVMQPEIEPLKNRLLARQMIAAITCVEQKIMTDMREADIGSLLGWGYPAYTGGIISHIDWLGTHTLLSLCEKLRKQYGDRFTPPKILREMGKGQERFYIRFL